MHRFLSDLKEGWDILRGNPGLLAGGVLALAVGICAGTLAAGHAKPMWPADCNLARIAIGSEIITSLASEADFQAAETEELRSPLSEQSNENQECALGKQARERVEDLVSQFTRHVFQRALATVGRSLGV